MAVTPLDMRVRALLERFGDYSRNEGDASGWTVRCPIHHPDDEVWAVIADDGTLHACSLGCEPGTMLDACAARPMREPGDDDDDPAPVVVPAKRTLAQRIIRLTRDSLRATPPDREYMLRDAASGEGVFIHGRVGIFAATGGSGKSWSLAQLAIAIATGTTWFGPGGWAPVKTGRVLLVLAEEEPEEVHRMLHFCARACGAISDQDVDAIVSRVTALDVTGLNVALTSQEYEGALLPETAFARALRSMLEQATGTDPYRCVILDPLSYFGGFDVEKDNAAATRWVQVVRTFTTPACGRSSVIVAHHEKKKGEGDDPTSADAIRGASALKDGVRWAARLAQEKRSEGSADLLTLRIVKANGIPPREPLTLCRSHEHEGALRLATRDEQSSNDVVAARTEKVRGKLEKYIDYVISNLAVGESCNANKFIDDSRLNRKAMLAAVRLLCADGVLDRPAKGTIFRLVPAGSSAGSETGFGSGSKVPDLRSRSEPGTKNHAGEEHDLSGSGSRTGTKEEA